jgi:hypothetical protein
MKNAAPPLCSFIASMLSEWLLVLPASKFGMSITVVKKLCETNGEYSLKNLRPVSERSSSAKFFRKCSFERLDPSKNFQIGIRRARGFMNAQSACPDIAA